MVDVRLVDLEVIKRYSLAVRRDTVPAGELLEALDASRALVAAALEADADAASAARTTRARSAAAGGPPALEEATAPSDRPGDEGS